MKKHELRKIYLEKRKLLSREEINHKNENIAAKFFQEFDLRKINFLHCFLPIEKFREIDTKLIFHKVWKVFPHIETLVPRVDFEKNEIENLKFTSATELVQNSWMISEPKHRELVESQLIDLVLVPLLCFDLQGFRVGYGKGFYDKFLRNCRADCQKIGVSFFPPVEKIFDANDFDVKLDFCITPEKIWNFEQPTLHF